VANNIEKMQESVKVEKTKQPYVLLWKYEKLFEEKYGKKPRINKYRDKMAMKDVIDTIGFERAMEVVEYYFKTSKSEHPLSFFLYNFDRLDIAEKELSKDRVNRAKMREATKRLVESE